MKAAIIPALATAIGAVFYLAPSPPHDVCLAAFSTSLVGRTFGQRHNAELALRRLKGAIIHSNQVFSFNSRVGTWSRDMGYRRAPVSYNGTLIATWGGGVCQTSTTLYNAALLAGMDIVERNSHRFCPEYVPPGRDAAVAFNDIDLKFRNPLPYDVKIDGEIKDDQLRLKLVGVKPLADKPQIVSDIGQVIQPREFHIRADVGTNQLTNTGKAGFDVATYRVTRQGRQLLSIDSYPPMNRIVEGD